MRNFISKNRFHCNTFLVCLILLCYFLSFSNTIFCYFLSLSLSLQFVLCFYSREVLVKRWQCSRKLGYCKHRYSSILHSSSSKGKLLIECGTKSVLFIPSLVLLTAVISLTILEGQVVCKRSPGGEVGLFIDLRDDLIIPANTRVSTTREDPENPKQCQTLFRNTFWPTDSFHVLWQIFAFLSYITFSSQMKKCNEKWKMQQK